MINSLDVLKAMSDWWIRAGADNKERTPFHAMVKGLTFLQQQNQEDYRKLKTDAAKIGHFRQLFTTWKAVAKKLESKLDGTPCYEFHYAAEDAVRAFPLFYEQFMPELFYVLWKKNVFLGVKFSADDFIRFEALEEKFVKDALEKERARNDEMFFNMFFGPLMKRPFG